ncbi:uncharacterized protein B0H18DRAFT_212499 [Fomitopsis serialis]|uniref:uncharacterized protein n=1 Tax=Fomitopsis serialis TaxID=139415 RepID=UPI0020082A97|nr:uncharacterized protein B0H18DRAFT_212499 [Neoantrodia serialis]KAH9929454.1 hypothetical protein B0H18DRAFT_212499 [Neoantrodia serialis]
MIVKSSSLSSSVKQGSPRRFASSVRQHSTPYNTSASSEDLVSRRTILVVYAILLVYWLSKRCRPLQVALPNGAYATSARLVGCLAFGFIRGVKRRRRFHYLVSPTVTWASETKHFSCIFHL